MIKHRRENLSERKTVRDGWVFYNCKNISTAWPCYATKNYLNGTIEMSTDGINISIFNDTEKINMKNEISYHCNSLKTFRHGRWDIFENAEGSGFDECKNSGVIVENNYAELCKIA